MYEHKYQALISPKKFIVRMLKHLAVTGSLIFLSLGIGILGYRIFVKSELDQFLIKCLNDPEWNGTCQPNYTPDR